MTKPSFVSLLFLATAHAAVEGTVVDPSGRPIRGARVECAGASAETALDGSFVFRAADRCDATVSARGFETATAALISGDHRQIRLAIEGVRESLVVTATRFETTAEEAGVSADVLTRSDLASREFPLLPDVLRELPGVAVTANGRPGALTSVFTRGAPSTGTLVLLDGMPLNDPGGQINAAHLTTDDLDRVEMVRAPSSVLFGAEASAGVIQLFTRAGDPETRRPHGSASYERGSFGADRWVANLTGGSGSRFDYSLNTGQLHTAGEFPNDFYRNTTGTANAGFRFGPNTLLRGIVRSYDAILGVPGQVAYGFFDFDAMETTRDTTVAVRLDDARGQHYLQRVSWGYHRLRDLFTDPNMEGPYPIAMLVRDVFAPVHRVYRVGFADPRNPPPVLPPGTRLIRDDVTVFPSDPFLSATSRNKVDYQGTWTHTNGAVVFGYDYQRQAGSVSDHDVDRNNHGGFVQAQHSFAGRVFVSGGIRLERSSAFGRKTVPRGAASFLLFRNTWFRVSAGRGITEPSLIQNFAKETFFIGNPTLRPEKTDSFEAGLVREWFGRRLRTEAAVFHNSFKDLIVFVSLPPPVFGSWDNIEASRARGVEFSTRARVTGWAYVNGAYTRMWTRIITSTSPSSLITGIGQELTRRPGNSGSVSLCLARRGWSFQVGAYFVGERQDTDFLGVTRNPGYQNVWASASMRAYRWMSPFLRADNLLNERYEETLGYSSLSRSVRGGLRLAW